MNITDIGSPSSVGRSKSLFSGWGSLWDVITGAEQERGDELNRRIIELNEQRVAAGRMTREQADRANTAVAADDPSAYRAAVGEAFLEGAAEGISAQQRWLNNAMNSVVSTGLGYVPTLVWVGLGVYGLYYLGAFDNLKGSLSRKTKH
jgi:hypothetical protein